MGLAEESRSHPGLERHVLSVSAGPACLSQYAHFRSGPVVITPVFVLSGVLKEKRRSSRVNIEALIYRSALENVKREIKFIYVFFTVSRGRKFRFVDIPLM